MISADEVRRRLAKPGPIVSTGWGQTATTSRLEADRPMLRTIVALYECVALLDDGYQADIGRREWWLRFEEITGGKPNPVPMTAEHVTAMS